MKLLSTLLLSLALLQGCANEKNIGGITYDTYGLLNKDENRNPDIEYRLVVGNIIWSVILCETIVAPIYFVGFSLYEPVAKNDGSHVKGQKVD